MVHDMHTRRRRPDYLQACPTGLPVDGVKSALTPALWPCAALWPCTFCSDLSKSRSFFDGSRSLSMVVSYSLSQVVRFGAVKGLIYLIALIV